MSRRCAQLRFAIVRCHLRQGSGTPETGVNFTSAIKARPGTSPASCAARRAELRREHIVRSPVQFLGIDLPKTWTFSTFPATPLPQDFPPQGDDWQVLSRTRLEFAGVESQLLGRHVRVIYN